MYAAPRYVKVPSSSIDKALVGLIHENPLQQIQGGAPGEHYHLTAAQHARASFYAEPAMTISGEIITIRSGDIVMEFIPLEV